MSLSLILFFTIVFWICAFLIAYTYVLYPILLLLAFSVIQLKRDMVYVGGRRDRRVRAASIAATPTVSMLIPAFNEEAHLPGKIENLRILDYPPEKLEILIISDGSSDRTNEMLQSVRAPHIKTTVLAQRGGKASALNLAAELASGSILLFSDASTLLSPDGIYKLARHFGDESVGVACGSLEFIGSDESKRTEGVYWKYESALRIMEARLGATLTASG